MRRTVTAHLAADVDDPALLALQIAVAGPPATKSSSSPATVSPSPSARSTAATAAGSMRSTSPPGVS